MAVAVGLLMLAVAADQSVAKLALLDPTVSTEAANGNNNTTNPAPPQEQPVLPPDEPQRAVEPGNVTQGWDNSSVVAGVDEAIPPTVASGCDQISYTTAYGRFALIQP